VGEGVLNVEGVTLARIAEAVGTPAYVYSAGAIRAQYRELDAALSRIPHRICYSVKANGNLAVLALLRSLGAGVDIVSGGELARALAAGFSGPDVVFSGVGKTADEMLDALRAGVGMINVESAEELDTLAVVARSAGIAAPTAIRVNPEVQLHVHPYTATGVKGKKFGVPYDEVEELAVRAAGTRELHLRGLAMHLGSGITEVLPFQEALVKLLGVVAKVKGRGVDTLTRLDLGGGLGIRYRSTDRPLSPQRFAEALVPQLAGSGMQLVVEPGRFIIGGAGQLLTRVLYRKESGGKLIAVVDAGMTDLIRPSHYQAYHEILVDGAAGRPHAHYDVVGPICESGDFFALDRELPTLEQGDLLALQGAGAYGFVMTSTYNARPRPPEVLVDDGRFAVVRARESTADLMLGETLEPAWQGAGAGAA